MESLNALEIKQHMATKDYLFTIYIPIYYLHIGASTNGPWDFKVNFGHGGGGHGASSFFIGGYSQQVENGPI